MKMKLAEALLRRKELASLLVIKGQFNTTKLYETKIARKQVAENIDEVTLVIPKLTLEQVTAEHDFCARQLRLIDAAIQHTNWTLEIDVDASCMLDKKPE